MVFPRTMAASEMEEGAKSSDLWEDAYMQFEDYVKSKNFNDDSPYKGIAHQIRSYFLMIHNYYQSSPDYEATQEALDLANNCLDIVEEIRQNCIGNTEFSLPYLMVLKRWQWRFTISASLPIQKTKQSYRT